MNNAGHGEMAGIAETIEAQFDSLFNVHVKGVFFLTQALLPLSADGGRIVNFSSRPDAHRGTRFLGLFGGQGCG